MIARTFSGHQSHRYFVPVLIAAGWLFLQPGLAWGQTTASVRVVARDLHEETAYITATAKDLHGRQEARNIPVIIFRPSGAGPFPLVVFNHGRAVANKRERQGPNRPEVLARYLVGKGFVVMAPTRIGYAQTYSDFDPEASGSCSNLKIEPMSMAGSDQVLATVAFAKTLPYVDTSRWLVSGISVGGLISVATVGRNPPGLLGGINFSGGAGGNSELSPGRPCSPHAIANYWSSLAKSAKAPMLWLYWQNDKYWGEEIPKQWHKAWFDAGGQATMTTFAPSGDDGHSGIYNDMDHWLPVVDAFLAQLGFDKPAIVVKPPVSDFADLADASKVPIGAKEQSTAYARFLDSKLPRAFAVGSGGSLGYATGDYAIGRALGFCQRSGQVCKLYAVDNDVVWTEK